MPLINAKVLDVLRFKIGYQKKMFLILVKISSITVLQIYIKNHINHIIYYFFIAQEWGSNSKLPATL